MPITLAMDACPAYVKNTTKNISYRFLILADVTGLRVLFFVIRKSGGGELFDGTERKGAMVPADETRETERKSEKSAGKRVGVAGFEPTTPSTPRKCATRLRYTPM